MASPNGSGTTPLTSLSDAKQSYTASGTKPTGTLSNHPYSGGFHPALKSSKGREGITPTYLEEGIRSNDRESGESGDYHAPVVESTVDNPFSFATNHSNSDLGDHSSPYHHSQKPIPSNQHLSGSHFFASSESQSPSHPTMSGISRGLSSNDRKALLPGTSTSVGSYYSTHPHPDEIDQPKSVRTRSMSRGSARRSSTTGLNADDADDDEVGSVPMVSSFSFRNNMGIANMNAAVGHPSGSTGETFARARTSSLTRSSSTTGGGLSRQRSNSKDDSEEGKGHGPNGVGGRIITPATLPKSSRRGSDKEALLTRRDRENEYGDSTGDSEGVVSEEPTHAVVDSEDGEPSSHQGEDGEKSPLNRCLECLGLHRLSALCTRDTAQILVLMVLTVFVSAFDWVLWKRTLNRFHSKSEDETYTFFVLQIYVLLELILAVIAALLQIHVFKNIDAEMRTFPLKNFAGIAGLDTLAMLCSSLAAPVVAGHIQTLLNQANLPTTMLFSFLILAARYIWPQYVGALFIVGGALFAAIPSVNDNTTHGGRETKAWGVIVYSLSMIPLSLSNILREYLFRGRKQLDIFYLMAWVSVFQFLFGFLCMPLLTIPAFGGTKFEDMPDQIILGWNCFIGNKVSDLDCHEGVVPAAFLLGYVILNFVVTILRLLLIKKASAVILQVTNAIALLTSNIMFCSEAIMGNDKEEFNSYDAGGLVFVLIGFIIFRGAQIYQARKEQKEKFAHAAVAVAEGTLSPGDTGGDGEGEGEDGGKDKKTDAITIVQPGESYDPKKQGQIILLGSSVKQGRSFLIGTGSGLSSSLSGHGGNGGGNDGHDGTTGLRTRLPAHPGFSRSDSSLSRSTSGQGTSPLSNNAFLNNSSHAVVIGRDSGRNSDAYTSLDSEG